MDKHIFNEEQLKRAEEIMANPLAKLSSLSSSELIDMAIICCYYSAKIEGNTYTYVETETLLKPICRLFLGKIGGEIEGSGINQCLKTCDG